MSYPAPRIEKQILATPTGPFVSFRMIEIIGSEFDISSEDEDAHDDEKPMHKVNVPTFWMGEFPVNQELWIAAMGENPSYFPGMKRPVEQVSWLDITEQFLPALQILTNREYRLPTEAEWEFAARGGIYHSPYKYAGCNRLEDVGWYDKNSHLETKDVGLKQPNVLGLYDMSGNVWEWCADWYDEKYYQTCADQGVVQNPTGPTQGRFRVLRGGSLSRIPGRCRVSYRFSAYPEFALYDRGFRLVVSSWQ